MFKHDRGPARGFAPAISHGYTKGLQGAERKRERKVRWFEEV